VGRYRCGGGVRCACPHLTFFSCVIYERVWASLFFLIPAWKKMVVGVELVEL
jgi:hypothetical protein